MNLHKCFMAICIIILNYFCLSVRAQSVDSISLEQLSMQYIKKVNDKARFFNKSVDKYTENAIKRMIKQEKLMQRKMSKIDTLKAIGLFKYSIDSLQRFKAIIHSKVLRSNKFNKGSYFGYLDTLQQSLSLIEKSKSFYNKSNELSSSFKSINEVSTKLLAIDHLKDYIQQRQNVLKSQLDFFPQLNKNFKKLRKESYYYQNQIAAYKTTLKDPAKIEGEVLKLVKQMPGFSKLMAENSQLSGLFTSPPTFSALNTGGNIPIVNGLMPRFDLQKFINENISSQDKDIWQPMLNLQQQVEAAKSKINELNAVPSDTSKQVEKSKDNFTPNTQKNKPFLKRLEYETDLQFGKSSAYLPADVTMAFELGYKLNDRSIIGIGVGYIMGIGNGWKNIKVSSEGLNARTYVKWELKRNLFIQGGSEWNYSIKSYRIDQFKNKKAWTQSGLLGLNKKYSINQRVKGNVQVLYDFLYNKHYPASQPIVFRFGYGL